MRIRQVVLAATDLAASRATLQALLQLPDPYRDPGVAEFGLDNAVFCFGDQFIEVVSPTQPDTAAGRHIARHGEGSGYMLILQTDDLARERARFDTLGVRTVWSKDLPDISATHLHPKDIGGAIVSLDEPRPAASWRWGGPDWRVADGDAGRQRVVGVTLSDADPQALARRYAEVLGLPPPQAEAGGDRAGAAHADRAGGGAGAVGGAGAWAAAGGAWRIPLEGGWLRFAPRLGGPAGLTGWTLRVADPAAMCRRAGALGLDVQADAIRLGPLRLSWDTADCVTA